MRRIAVVSMSSRRGCGRSHADLVIHGKRDILVPPRGGLDTTAHIQGAWS